MVKLIGLLPHLIVCKLYFKREMNKQKQASVKKMGNIPFSTQKPNKKNVMEQKT